VKLCLLPGDLRHFNNHLTCSVVTFCWMMGSWCGEQPASRWPYFFARTARQSEPSIADIVTCLGTPYQDDVYGIKRRDISPTFYSTFYFNKRSVMIYM